MVLSFKDLRENNAKGTIMNRVVHFEIPADDPGRAKKFYEDVFGWEIKKWDSPDPEMDYWLITTGEKDMMGINGGLFKRERKPSVSMDHNDAGNSVITVGVEDIDQIIEKITQNNGEIVEKKMEIPMMGWLIYARDTEGNIFGAMQSTMKEM